MTNPVDICSLDYLIGTIATAYKGMITSLVAKDFCMTEEDGTVTFRGTVLSMPQGDYTAALMHEGEELGKTRLKEGFFSLAVSPEAIAGAGNLQMDILQNGRHIGTFLLKREKQGQFFASAMEVSEDLKGLDLRLLTARLHGKPGLLQKAEEIVSQILSTKKDWRKFSEAINSFAVDVFWHDRETFHKAYPILVRYSARASENADSKSRGKLVANVLALLELPLEKEEDGETLGPLAEAWLKEVENHPPDLSLRHKDAVRLIRSVLGKCTDICVSPLIKPLVAALKERISRAPALPRTVMATLAEEATRAELSGLARYTETSKEETLREISNIEALAEGGKYDEVTARLGSLDPGFSDDTAMIDAVFSLLGEKISRKSAARFSEVVFSMFPVFASLSFEARKKAMRHVAGLLRDLIGLGMADAGEALLSRIGEAGIRMKEEMLLDAEVGSAVLKSGNGGLLESYKRMLKEVLIPSPHISGFSSETWAETANPLHLERLSRFMNVIQTDSETFSDVLVHVICNLYIGGVFIPDDKLFQRQVSSYLNAGTFGKNFLLNYLLLGKLPVYFNEVGATGRIRDLTTQIDAWGNDTVLYFLRKQVHVNASNYNIRLVERIILSWVRNDPELLRGSVPDDVLAKADRELFDRYSSAIGPFLESLGIMAEGELHLERLLRIPEDDMRDTLQEEGISEEISSKIFLLCRTYQEIVRKYSSFSAGEAEGNGRSRMTRKLRDLLDHAGKLREVIVSPEMTEAEESLYYKRHIAFGIPSVMGSYREPKFDAFGEFLRTEERIRIIFEDLAPSIREGFSMEDLEGWISSILLLKGLFDLHGLNNFQADELAAVLPTNDLRISQVADIFRIWQRELTWIVDFFYRTFHKPMMEILRIFPREEMKEHLRDLNAGGKDFAEKAADVVIRDIMSGVAGLLELDSVFNSLLPALNAALTAGLDEEFRMNSGRPREKVFFGLDELDDRTVMALAPLLGSKAKNLMYLQNRGLLVPAGVVFTARKTPQYEEFTRSGEFRSALREAVRKVEEQTGAVFGDGKNPLFLSVRSGSYISMPGILSSVLYCGMNSAAVRAVIERTGDARMAWDSRRRFMEHYATVVLGIEESLLDEILSGLLKRTGREKREDLDEGELEELTSLYDGMLKGRGLGIPEDVYEQLSLSVRGVYRSWYSEKALQFRKAMNVSEHWGTAVAIMEMVPGNAAGGGSSVFFTRRPFTMESDIYGESRESATGDDLVYGRLTNHPISRRQAMEGQKNMEESDPALFRLHRELAKKIEEAMRGLPQEVEATFVRGPLGERIIYVLQTRRMEFHRGFTRRFQDVCRMESSVIGRGIGVHGGALSGVAVLSSSVGRIRGMREENGLPVVLLRQSASTEDVSLMAEIDAIVTSAGGATSHAAVLAQKFDLTAVVGCTDMKIREDEKGEPSAEIGGRSVREGDPISLDGSTGLVYSGLCMFTERSPSH